MSIATNRSVSKKARMYCVGACGHLFGLPGRVLFYILCAFGLSYQE